jgi:histidinol-phosphatase (PHP family)
MIERGGIDALAHIDLMKIHGVWHPDGGLLPHFAGLLARVQREGLAIEISTAGWRKPVGEQYPHVDLIREAQRLGIPFTLASDAHSHAQLGEDYGRLAELLASLGIREVAAYEKHRRRMIPLTP